MTPAQLTAVGTSFHRTKAVCIDALKFCGPPLGRRKSTPCEACRHIANELDSHFSLVTKIRENGIEDALGNICEIMLERHGVSADFLDFCEDFVDSHEFLLGNAIRREKVDRKESLLEVCTSSKELEC
jgi:hypothetical protein